MIIFLIIILIILFLIWNSKVLFYKDKNTYDIEPNLENVFSEKVKPIELIHENKSNKAIIFIHGFPSSPASYHWVSKEAFKDDYDVFAPLLPGFGTTLEEFKDTYFTQWFNYICKYYENIRKNYKNVYLVGMSMGGAIVLKLNEKYDNSKLAPNASCTIAAPITLHSPFIGIFNFTVYLTRLINIFTPYINAKIHKGLQEKNDGNEKWMGYTGIYVRQGISLLNALKFIKKDLNKINKPILLIHNKTDKTVSYKNLKYIYNNISSNRKEKILVNMSKKYTHNRHILLTYDSTQQETWDNINKFFNIGEINE